MQTFKVNLPSTNNPFFIHVGRPPQESKIDMVEKQMEVVLDTGKELIKARVFDYLEYPFNHISDAHSRLAYGLSAVELRKHLRQHQNMNETDTVCFYILQKIMTDTRNQPKTQQLPGLIG